MKIYGLSWAERHECFGSVKARSAKAAVSRFKREGWSALIVGDGSTDNSNIVLSSVKCDQEDD